MGLERRQFMGRGRRTATSEPSGYTRPHPSSGPPFTAIAPSRSSTVRARGVAWSAVLARTAVGATLRKGEEMGYFQFGGSDFVMLFERGCGVRLEASALPAGSTDGTSVVAGRPAKHPGGRALERILANPAAAESARETRAHPRRARLRLSEDPSLFRSDGERRELRPGHWRRPAPRTPTATRAQGRSDPMPARVRPP